MNSITISPTLGKTLDMKIPKVAQSSDAYLDKPSLSSFCLFPASPQEIEDISQLNLAKLVDLIAFQLPY